MNAVGIFGSFMEKRGYNTAERIMMCLLTALSGTFFFYEYYQPFADAARIIITFLIFIIWFYCAFCSGKDRQWGFAVFEILYWMIPYIYLIFYNSRDNVRGYSKWLSLLNKIADMLFLKPFEFSADKLDIAAEMMAAAVFCGTTLSFFVGYAMKILYNRHKGNSVSNEKTDAIPEKND